MKSLVARFTSHIDRTTARLALVAVAALAALALAAPALAAEPETRPAPEAQKAPVTQPFREEHAEIRTHLDHIRQMAGELRAQNPAEQQATMKHVVSFLNGNIRPHAEWEEQVLYPVVDKLTKSGSEPFTSTMRHDHTVVGRWIDELAAEATSDKPSADAFARRTDNVLGLLAAHFESEEDVLLPYIDRGMTADQFKTEVLDKMKQH